MVICPTHTTRRPTRAKDWPGYFGSPLIASAKRGTDFWKSYSKAPSVWPCAFSTASTTAKFRAMPDIISADPHLAGVLEDERNHDSARKQKQEAWLKKNGIE